MILRDYLAIDRTVLTNETAFMAYIRTALALLAAGVSLIKFFNDPVMNALGWAFMGIGTVLAMYGYHRYRQIDALMHRIKGDMIEEHIKASNKSKNVSSWALKLFRRNN